MHPLLRLIASQPHLLAEHASGYGELLAAEIGAAATQWRRRALLSASALCCAGVSAVLAGVALMLWATLPPGQIHAAWSLVAAPLVPAIAAACLALAARGRGLSGSFDPVRQQMRADLLMLREAGGS